MQTWLETKFHDKFLFLLDCNMILPTFPFFLSFFLSFTVFALNIGI